MSSAASVSRSFQAASTTAPPSRFGRWPNIAPAFKALTEQAGILAVPQILLSRSPRRPRTTQRWPKWGAAFDTFSACAASVLPPRRMPVAPAANYTRGSRSHLWIRSAFIEFRRATRRACAQIDRFASSDPSRFLVLSRPPQSAPWCPRSMGDPIKPFIASLGQGNRTDTVMYLAISKGTLFAAAFQTL